MSANTNKTNINTEGGTYITGDQTVQGDVVHRDKIVIQEAEKKITFPLIRLPAHNPNFTGRTDLLDAIQSSFQNQQSSIAIAGLGGVGKTQLALAYAHRQRETYDLIYRFNAENEPALAESLMGLGRALHLPVDKMDRPIAVAAVLTWIASTPKRWLLIYDNVDSFTPRDLRSLIPGGQGHLLITSRNPYWHGTAQVLNVDVFTPEEAAHFLQVRSGHFSTQPSAQVRIANEELAKELGNLPLALEHAAAYMETRGKTATEYLALFRARRQEIWVRAEPPDDYHATITTTWQMAFDHAQQTPGAAELLNLCCFLAPDDIPLSVIREHIIVLPEKLAQVLADELGLDDALMALTRYSLITKQDELLAIHRLVQTVARDQMSEELEKEWVATAIEMLRNAYHFDQYDISTWSACGQLLPQMIFVINLAEELEVNTSHAAFLNNWVGFYFNYFGQPVEAQPYYERDLAINEQTLGPDHPDTARSLNNIGAVLRIMSQLDEAEPYLQRALTINEEVLGLNHPDTATSYYNLGSLLQDKGQLAESQPYFERSLAINEQMLGPDHPNTAISLNNIGILLQDMGKSVEAKPYYERALVINEKVLGSNHPETARNLNNIGFLLQSMGQLEEAKPYYERALAIDEKVLGTDHPSTARALNNIGYLLQAMGQLSKVMPYFERALAIRKQTFGLNHPETAQCFHNIGALLQAKEQFVEARIFYKRALTIYGKILGSDHFENAESLNNLALISLHEGDIVEAAWLMRRALAIFETVLGAEHPSSIRSRESLLIIEAVFNR